MDTGIHNLFYHWRSIYSSKFIQIYAMKYIAYVLRYSVGMYVVTGILKPKLAYLNFIS